MHGTSNIKTTVSIHCLYIIICSQINVIKYHNFLPLLCHFNTFTQSMLLRIILLPPSRFSNISFCVSQESCISGFIYKNFSLNWPKFGKITVTNIPA